MALRKLLLLILAGNLFGCSQHSSVTDSKLAEQGKPNIIFIMADDLGYGDLGCYGQTLIQTPNIDQLAKEGIRFTQCYTGSTVCAPSRSVLMTGQHTGHTTVRGNMGIGGVVGLGGAEGRIPLQATDTTVATVLKSAGYVTGMIGKWGLGEPNTSGEPNRQGFDFFYGFLNQRRAHHYYPEYIWRDTVRVDLPGNHEGQEETYVHDLFTKEAIDFVNRYQDTSFFLYLPYTSPHDDYEVPDLGIYADSVHWQADEQIYAAMVSRLDQDVGRIMKQIKDLGIDKNTMVFFCSDNGAAQFWEGRFDSSGILRGRKRDMYEGGIRTPMIVRYPDRIKSAIVSDEPWYFADLLPTLSELAGAESPKNIDGISVLSLLGLDSQLKADAQRYFYWEFYELGFQQAIRQGKWKGVKLAPETEWEIYDLEADPGEQQNLAKAHPEIVEKMATIAKKEHIPSPFFQVKTEHQ